MVESKSIENDLVEESKELMKDEEFIESYKKSKDQVKKREFVKWNKLKFTSS